VLGALREAFTSPPRPEPVSPLRLAADRYRQAAANPEMKQLIADGRRAHYLRNRIEAFQQAEQAEVGESASEDVEDIDRYRGSATA
jgi:hypothetical protein